MRDLKPYHSLKDKDLGIDCGRKLVRDIILFVVLHEMGHNFGLTHNFKASIDEKNYYKSESEIQEYFPQFKLANLQTDQDITKTSSVMDYISVFDVFPFTVLGKYDLEALRFLYMDQIISEGNPVSLNTSRNPEEQTNLRSLDFQPQYKSCPDWEQTQLLCAPGDDGFTP